MNNKNSCFDIIIVGGGLVGLTAANLCAENHFSVAVIEPNPPPLSWPDKEYDHRSVSINRASQNILKKMGVWNDIVSQRISPFRTMKVWDAEGFGEISFDAVDVAETDLGHIIENRVILKALWEKAITHENLTIFSPSKAKTIKCLPDDVIIELDNSIIISGKLIIGADGGRSELRKHLNIQTTERSYHQCAMVATVTTELSHQETAWQRFLPDGPLAFLPLSEPHTSSIVWTNTPEKTEQNLLLSELEFCETLSYQFDYRLGNVKTVQGKRQSFPLTRLHSKQYVTDRAALIGDAAHVIHPLAGQGVNLGFLDAAELSEILIHAASNQYDIGHRQVLRRYERARKTHNVSLLAVTDFFKHLFGNKFSSVVLVRSLGMDLTHKSSMIKNEILLRAMGLKGDLPVVARGV